MKSSPTPPDPYQTAQTQNQFNVGTANANQRVNMVDQSNPFGSLAYNQTGTNPDGTAKFSANSSLSQPLQTALGGLYGKGALSGNALDLSYDGTAGRLDALNKARLDPQWQQNTDSQESKLAAQGLTPGMPGYDNAMRVFNQGKNDAYNSANLADYGQAASAAQAEYNSPLQTAQGISSLANGARVNTPTTNVAGTNYAGLAEDAYKQQSANANAANGQLGGIFGSILGAGANLATGGASGMFSKMGGLFGGGSPSGYGK
jgi:hypothetical protein